jgi:ABC-type transporter Mla MlaB component
MGQESSAEFAAAPGGDSPEAGTVMRLRFAGVQTVSTIEQAAAVLRQALAQAATVVVDCADLQEADLTFLQLLLSAQRSAVAAGKRFSMAAPASGVLAQALIDAGLRNSEGTEVKGHDGFWRGGA